MGRPRLHDERTRESLLAAAERLISSGGAEELSVRRVAEEAGTTTRAVYTVFGSKVGLQDALGSRAFVWLARALRRRKPADDPVADVIEVGARVFRQLVIKHPGLYAIGFQRSKSATGPQTRIAAQRAMAELVSRLERLPQTGLLASLGPDEVAWQVHATCEGLASLELRGALPPHGEEEAWRALLSTVVTGLLRPAARHAPSS